jgi:hypothetical protein
MVVRECLLTWVQVCTAFHLLIFTHHWNLETSRLKVGIIMVVAVFIAPTAWTSVTVADQEALAQFMATLAHSLLMHHLGEQLDLVVPIKVHHLDILLFRDHAWLTTPSCATIPKKAPIVRHPLQGLEPQDVHGDARHQALSHLLSLLLLTILT